MIKFSPNNVCIKIISIFAPLQWKDAGVAELARLESV